MQIQLKRNISLPDRELIFNKGTILNVVDKEEFSTGREVKLAYLVLDKVGYRVRIYESECVEV